MRSENDLKNEKSRVGQTKHHRSFRRAMFSLAALACASSIDSCEAFAFGNIPLHHSTDNISSVHHTPLAARYARYSRDSRTELMYAPPNHPTSKTAPMVAQAFYSSYTTNRNPVKPRNHKNHGGGLSNSVLSSSDTLPSFPTAHGLLSPETVIRMEIMTSSTTRDEAVEYFLRTYRKDGPMACLHMLSDPNVLPRLTEAMRDIIQ